MKSWNMVWPLQERERFCQSLAGALANCQNKNKPARGSTSGKTFIGSFVGAKACRADSLAQRLFSQKPLCCLAVTQPVHRPYCDLGGQGQVGSPAQLTTLIVQPPPFHSVSLEGGRWCRSTSEATAAYRKQSDVGEKRGAHTCAA